MPTSGWWKIESPCLTTVSNILKKRYGRDEVSKARIAKNARQVYAMERDIYSVLHEDPADLLDLVPAME